MAARAWGRRVLQRLGRDALEAEHPTAVAPTGADDWQVVAATPLFDHAWYAMVADRRFDREAAARHYVTHGRARELSPHPLFDPATLRRKLRLDDDADALLVYLAREELDLEVHPLFDVARYLEQHPEAETHPGGPVVHYVEVGARAGARPNDWYEPSPDQPGGLVDWVVADARAWAERRRAALPTWGRAAAPAHDATAGSSDQGDRLTSVVLVAADPALVRRSVESLLTQAGSAWELVVAGTASGLDPATLDLPDDPRIRIDERAHTDRWSARNAALELVSGTHVAWMEEGDQWLPGRLAALHVAQAGQGWRWWHDAARDERPDILRRHATRPTTAARLAAGNVPVLGTLVVERALLDEVGPFDTSRTCDPVLDLAFRLAEQHEAGFVRRLGVLLERVPERDSQDTPWQELPFGEVDARLRWADVARSRHLVPWPRLEREAPEGGLVTVVVAAAGDAGAKAAAAAVRGLREEAADERCQVVVVDQGVPVVGSGVLTALQRYDDLTLVRVADAPGAGLGANLALGAVRGQVVVHLAGARATPGSVTALAEALADGEVVAAQPVVRAPDGNVASAGLAFPPGAGLPHQVLAGFPVEDVAPDAGPLQAVTGAALAVRRDDLVAVGGFDPRLRHSMYDADLCQRLARHREGRCVLVTGAEAALDGAAAEERAAATPGGDHRLYLARWWGSATPDDARLWRAHGYDVQGRWIRDHVSPDTRLCVAEPQLVRHVAGRVEVDESPPRLRWAIKSATPYGPHTERWGDTHFARHVAEALRDCGQEVVIDHQQAFARDSAWHDDVTLTIRGLTPGAPLGHQISLVWLISHPELVTRAELAGYDHVFVASTTHARTLAAGGVPATPLLQATDPARFHPASGVPGTGDELLFVGNSRNHPRPLVISAVQHGLPVAIYGAGWEPYVPAGHVRGLFVPNDRLSAAYRAARLVLNDHWDDMRELGFLSNRLFDAVASGARVVSDAAAGMREVFGDAVVQVADGAELARVVGSSDDDLDAVFGTDEERLARAARVAAEHSFRARAQTLVEHVARLHAARAGSP